MSSKRGKLTSKERTRVFFTSIICILIICFCVVSSFGNIISISNKRQEKKELTKRLETLKVEEQTLSDDVEKLKNPEYAARYAREKYFYSKNGEKILKID